MKLTNDLSVRKWKPKKDGERVSCGERAVMSKDGQTETVAMYFSHSQERMVFKKLFG